MAGELRDRLVVLIGGSGFFGRHLAQALLAQGARLRVACRHPARAYEIKALGNLGQVQLGRCDVAHGGAGLAAAVAGADAVVNLVGAFAGDLDAIQGAGGGGRVANAAREAGARAFVHISAIGANPASPTSYGRTKATGEMAALAAFASATVLRPSVLFGPDDNFLNLFARLIAAFPALPVFGPEARLQPLFVDDAAAAVVAALTGNLADPAIHGGRIYEIAGPEVLTMLEINRRIAAAQGRVRAFAPLPDPVSGAIAAATGWLPGAPLSRDQWLLLRGGNVAAPGMPGLAELGIEPRPLGLFLDRWMVRYRKHGRFGPMPAVT